MAGRTILVWTLPLLAAALMATLLVSNLAARKSRDKDSNSVDDDVPSWNDLESGGVGPSRVERRSYRRTSEYSVRLWLAALAFVVLTVVMLFASSKN